MKAYHLHFKIRTENVLNQIRKWLADLSVDVSSLLIKSETSAELIDSTIPFPLTDPKSTRKVFYGNLLNTPETDYKNTHPYPYFTSKVVFQAQTKDEIVLIQNVLNKLNADSRFNSDSTKDSNVKFALDKYDTFEIASLKRLESDLVNLDKVSAGEFSFVL